MDNKSAAQVSSIEKAIISFEFILSTVIWYEALSKANPVSKNLQLSNVNIDIAVSQISSLIAIMNKCRKSGFTKCLDQWFSTRVLPEQSRGSASLDSNLRVYFIIICILFKYTVIFDLLSPIAII